MVNQFMPLLASSTVTEAATAATEEGKQVIIPIESGVPTLAETIADLGVMIVISAIVLIFLIRSLNAMLDQSKQVSSTIVPKLNEIPYSINQVKAALAEHLSAHNISTNKQLSAIELRLDHITKDIERISRELDQRREADSDIMLQMEKIEGILLVIQTNLGIQPESKFYRNGKRKRSTTPKKKPVVDTKNNETEVNEDSGEES